MFVFVEGGSISWVGLEVRWVVAEEAGDGRLAVVEDGGDLGLREVFDLVEDDCGNAPVLDCVVGFGWDLGEWEWELGGGEFGEH